MEPKTKQSLLVTVVGVTLFVALLRLSDVLAFAAKLIDLVLPILAGGILALFINVPMTGLEKRLNRLFGKAKKQPSAKAIHLLSFFRNRHCQLHRKISPPSFYFLEWIYILLNAPRHPAGNIHGNRSLWKADLTQQSFRDG